MKKNTKKDLKNQNEDHVEVSEACQQETEKYKNLYLRALADYKNLENRTSKERQEMRRNIKKQIILDLLPILDNLDQAQVFTKDPGLQMISSSFRKALSEMGVSEVELVGKKFDPDYAEVIEVIQGKEDSQIISVIQKAYALDGQVIRHGKVSVGKKS